jgi:hypothetical protein
MFREKILTTRPEELLIPDELGNLPLHIVTSSVQQRKPSSRAQVDALLGRSGRCPRYTKLVERTPRPSLYKVSIIKILLEAHPDAAAVKNNQGRYPLHLALASGKTWDGGIRELVTSYPDAVREADPVTGLFPFHLAATVNEVSTVQSVHVQRLNVIYEMLRTDPVVASQSR